MVYQSYYLFGIKPYPDFLWFVFFASLCSYNFHWYLTPALYGGSYRTQWSIRNKKLHFVLFILGLGGCTWFGIQLLFYWKWLLLTAFITFLYSAPKIPFPPFHHLKKIAVGKTIFLALVWTHITVALPLLLSKRFLEVTPVIFFINRFFLIYPICILFDYRDREEDKKQGIKSMITFFSEKNIDRLFYFSMLIFLITGIALYLPGVSFIYSLALFIPGAITFSIYDYSKKNTVDYYYYFFLDGLMMLSALLIFIFQF
jgi:4-hydroxybenzoate polyprenyltransferase